MKLGSFHTHTHYCDGTAAPADYLQAAIDAGLVSYGFSSHAPLPFERPWAMRTERLPEYLNEIRQLQKIWSDRIEVFAGLEIDFIPDVVGPSTFMNVGLDYTIGSVHFIDRMKDGTPFEADGPTSLFEKGLQEIFDGDVRACIGRYYALLTRMVKEDPPTIVGHLDKIKMHNHVRPFFEKDEAWYRNAVFATLEAIAASGCKVEVNTRGVYLGKTSEAYPSVWILREMRERKIPVVISSDAHHPSQVAASYDTAIAALRNAGYESHQVLMQGIWQEVPLR